MKIAMGTLHLRPVQEGFHTRLRSAKLSALGMCMHLAALDLDLGHVPLGVTPGLHICQGIV